MLEIPKMHGDVVLSPKRYCGLFIESKDKTIAISQKARNSCVYKKENYILSSFAIVPSAFLTAFLTYIRLRNISIFFSLLTGNSDWLSPLMIPRIDY